MDLSKTIIPKSDQLNADDLIGTTKTIKIREIKGTADDKQPVSIYFDGDNNKPYKPCKSMRRLLVQVWGNETDNFIGRSMTLYRDDTVTFGAVKVGGIRISHVSHITEPVEVLITVSKAKRRPVTVYPLKVEKTKQDFKKGGFEKALKAIQDGKVQAQDIIEKYNLTDEQLNQITNG
jgi:hypothetical protein